jgi:hypothetical protein
MRGYLALIIFSVVVPVVTFAAILFSRYYVSEFRRVDEELLGDARQIALTVDRELSGLQSILLALTTSNPLAVRDYERFYQQALRVRERIGIDILLRDVSGQQIVNTRVAWGAPLPLEPLEGDQQAIETRRSVISNVFTGAVAHHPVVTITVPIVSGDRVTHFLNLSIEAERFTEIVTRSVGADRSAGIIDRRGVILARSSRANEFVGTSAAPGFATQMTGEEGIVSGAVNGTGEPVRAAYARSNLASWKVWVSIPEKSALAPLLGTLWTLATLGLALAAAAFLIAYAVGGRLANSIQALAGQAAALERGETLGSQHLPVREFNEVSREIVAASIRIRERERERD